MVTDTQALALYILDTLDFDPEYEDDAFAFSFDGQRIYCERRRNHFRVEVGVQTLLIPRH